MHADFFEQPAMHHRHDSAAAPFTGIIGAVPIGANKAPRLAGIERFRRLVLEFFDARANLIAQ
jgi:hypothetical protein